MKFRILNDEGVDRFRVYLAGSASEGEAPPRHLLSRENTSQNYKKDIFLQVGKKFSNKNNFGEYLVRVFDEFGVSRHEVIKDRNFWASVILFYFEQFAPLDENGFRKIAKDEKDANEKFLKYIPKRVSNQGEGLFFRHLALGPYQISEYNRDTKNKADVLLSGKINVWGDDIEQTAGRVEVISNKNLIEVIRMLYWDSSKGTLKKGFSSKGRPGNLLRLVGDLRNQVKLTKDWYSMDAEEIYDSLPPEYDDWKIDS